MIVGRLGGLVARNATLLRASFQSGTTQGRSIGRALPAAYPRAMATARSNAGGEAVVAPRNAAVIAVAQMTSVGDTDANFATCQRLAEVCVHVLNA